MIITLMGADFSKSNIGTLTTVLVTKSIGSGATHTIPDTVDRGATGISWTITLDSGYTFGTYNVTMGGSSSSVTTTLSDDSLTLTIAIAEVTGNIVISVPTVNENTGE